jgi:uncharacterized protein
MSGMDWRTGKLISDRDQLIQSIRVILTTPKFSRIVRRDFGSDVFDLIDQPETAAVDFTRAVAEALVELDNFALKRSVIRRISSGQIEIIIDGEYTPANEPIRLEVPL